MNAQLINQIAKKKKELESGKNEVLRSKENLGCFGFRKVKEDAFVKIAAKVQRYVDLSLELRKKHPEFGGLPPTELSEKPKGQFVPIEKTAAIDQQRQLYAAARSALIDPAYADQILGELIDWHDAFVHHFVVDERNGPRVRAKVIFGSNASSDDPDPQANLRLTYALQGSATLVGALGAAADRPGDVERKNRYRAKADSIKELCLAIGEQFYRDYADIRLPGRYFLYPGGMSEIKDLKGLSHNNSQNYLIEGMAALAELNRELWLPRLNELLEFIKTQRDQASGLLHEFDFESKDVPFPHGAVSNMEDFKWQSQGNHETVVLGHTLAGVYTWPARFIADSSNPDKLQKMTALIEDFVKTMNLIHGIKKSGLPANGFQLTLDGNRPCIAMVDWSDGAWQAELLWQFLLHADRAGVDLKRFEVKAESDTLTLDRLLAECLDYHDKHLFDGIHYVKEVGNKLEGREYAAPINHATDTLRDLAFNLE